MAEPDARRSSAAQFFAEEDAEASKNVSVYTKVVELLNEASLVSKDSQKVGNLKQVQELVIHKDPNLLDNFFDEMIAFQSDRSVDVRKFIVGFMEEVCKKDPDLLTKVMPCLQHLLQDENVNVVKKVILTLSSVYRTLLMWLSKCKQPTSEMTQVWDIMAQMKKTLYEMLDSENDGIRTHAVKFAEGILLTLSWKTKDSDVPKSIKPESDVSLESIPEGSKYLKVKKLEEEGQKMFEALLQFLASPHISSINLMTVMGSLTNVTKQRPTYFQRVVQAFEALHVNLPPTLAKSQVSSVRKNLKMQMLSLLKHPCSVDHLSSITTLLTDLGATQAEVMKVMPKISEDVRKRKAASSDSSSKKPKIDKGPPVDDDDDDIGMTPWADRQTDKKLSNVKLRSTAIDITAEDLIPRLNAHNVADLVLISMVMLPDQLPAHFQATYTPIAAAGTEGQVGHMARLLATQLTMAGMGKGIAEVQREAAKKETVDLGSETPAFQGTSSNQSISTVVGGLSDEIKPPDIKAMLPPPAAPSRRGVKQFKLSTVTHSLPEPEMEEMASQAMDRLILAEKVATVGNAMPGRTKLLSSLVAQFGGDYRDKLQMYIFEDLRNRSDVAFAWVYQEYASCMNFLAVSPEGGQPEMDSYDNCLTGLLSQLSDKTELKDVIFHNLLMEAPSVTDNALQILRQYCWEEDRVQAGLDTLKALIMTRPVHRLRFLDVLLEFTSSDKNELRSQAINFTKELYETQQVGHAIEYYAVQMLKYLLLPQPSPELYAKLRRGQEAPENWVDDAMKMCLFLYLGLLPSNHKLIHELATVYTSTAADIKRTILRMLEGPVKGMGMQSPELLLFVENCPKGSETLVTRVIHILTDKAAPSTDLVERVRDLYHKRVPDVRFLIPVLIGLQKKEVVAALPKLIKLNPVVVKEVFNRLLGGHGDVTYQSPLTPAELLIALHNVDDKVDMKTIIKATNLCFAEKKVYTQEVLALVMQQLMEEAPLPTLFMRTVLQALSMYPRLLGLVLNILQRLIKKQVWTQKKVWEGFVRCCLKTKPQSFQVLLQLPAPQLKNVFEICPELQEPLLGHVMNLTPIQRQHIAGDYMTVLQTDVGRELREREQRAQEEARVERLRKEADEMDQIRRDAEERARKDKEGPEKVSGDKRRVEEKRRDDRRVETDRRRGDDDDRRRSRDQKEHGHSQERDRLSKENRIPVKREPGTESKEQDFVKPVDPSSEPPRDRTRDRVESKDKNDHREQRIANPERPMNPERPPANSERPVDSERPSNPEPESSKGKPSPVRPRNQSPRRRGRNRSPGSRNEEPMDVDLSLVKSEPADKPYEKRKDGGDRTPKRSSRSDSNDSRRTSRNR